MMGYYSMLDGELSAPHKELFLILQEADKQTFRDPAFVRSFLFSLIDERKEHYEDYSDLLSYIFRLDTLERNRANCISG